MAISTALGKLAKLLACDPVNSQDVGNLQAEYDATFREKPLNSVCAKKMIGLIRQHASCTASAEVFPVLLVILAAMTENQASFRVLLDQSLCDAIQDVSWREFWLTHCLRVSAVHRVPLLPSGVFEDQ